MGRSQLNSNFFTSAFGWRVVSSIIMLGLVAVALWLQDLGVILLLMACTVLMAFEWAAMCKITLRKRAAFTLIISIYAALLCTYTNHLYLAMGCLFLSAAVNILLGWLSWRRGFLWLALGILYIGIPTSLLIWLMRTFDNGIFLLIWLMVIVCCNDVGGYMVGRLVGGVKLAPRISPNKTWSGFFGGLIFVGVGAYIYYHYYPLGFDFNEFLLASFGIAILATFGDLIESALKRFHKVKDSGRLIPGHGGVFDRIDGFFLAIPALALLGYLLPQMFASPSPVIQEEMVLLPVSETLE